MRIAKPTNAFKKDLKLQKKRGKDITKLERLIVLLQKADIRSNGSVELPDNYRNHKLVGNWVGRWECHIEPNWLLTYRLNDEELLLERTGRHEDIFND